MAEGSWPLEFKYMITSLDRTHAGFYRCIVRNRMGALLQRQTEVQVAYMGSFEDSETQQSVSHGEAAVIRAPRIASFPQPQVTWFRDGRKISPSSRIAITLENTLVILSTVAPDAGRYYVQAVNDKNGDNKTSQPITLTVANVGGPADPIAPTIIVPPRNTSVVAGTSEVTMECVANARPLIKLHIIWKKDGTPVSSGISDYSRRLTILHPALSDSGFYECEAVLRSSSVPAVTAGAYLSVLEPPQFVREPERHITAEMEKVVAIPCQAKGELLPGTLPMAWYKDAALLQLEKLSRFQLLEDGSLQISGLLPDDTGMFQCFARNAAGEVQTTTYLAVTSRCQPPSALGVSWLGGIAPNITRGPQDSTVIDGMSVILNCETSGAPRPAITWQKGERVLASGSVQLPRFTLLESGSLLVSPAHLPDAGTYTCLATNSRGVDEASADLVVWGKGLTVGPCHPQPGGRDPAGWSSLGWALRFVDANGDCPCWCHPRSAGRSLCVPAARTRITDPPQDQSVIKGTKAIMSCGVTHDPSVDVSATWCPATLCPLLTGELRGTSTPGSSWHRYVWEKDGTPLGPESGPRVRLDELGTLHISQTWSGDIGTYTCKVISAGGNDSRSAHLRVRQLPHAPESPVAALSPQEKRAINLTWAKPFDGNSPLLRYVVEVSENSKGLLPPPWHRWRCEKSPASPWCRGCCGELGDPGTRQPGRGPQCPTGQVPTLLSPLPPDAPWTVLLASVDPEVTSVTVRGLVPARSYQFRLCAVNDVGRGQFSKDTERVSLPEEPPSAPPQNVIASGRTNQSIMIQWQPPPESHQNGVLKGYIIRYCLAGLPVGYQFKNITNAEVNNLLLEDLIIWTNYEIEVAAYNSAGLGVYSMKVTEWTLQGVPTVPPGNVQAEATNSTTIRFTWNPPSPQFINGINQGYKLIAWEPEHEDEPTVVTVRPNFQDSIHVGYVAGLRKFAEYFTSVLCFTTPGDGPRSPAQLVRTHEDGTGRFGPCPPPVPSKGSPLLAGLLWVLSFGCFWAVPGPVGHLSFSDILDTSLKVSWQEPLEKNGILTGYRISWEEYNRTNTRVTHYLPNVTLEYRVTGLTALTTYTIEVAAMTSKGQGQLSSSTISSGVPPGEHGAVGVLEGCVRCWGQAAELPGAPTNLGISNIGPRSVTIQFRPGYDGKTSISRWQVEAQVGQNGEAGQWGLVHQLANEPNTHSMEVPNLKPYTYYRRVPGQCHPWGNGALLSLTMSPPHCPSQGPGALLSPTVSSPSFFRMRQVNIVGTSPPSLPSRRIQTLQAPPDMAPANVTLRTASETSLWLRWMVRGAVGQGDGCLNGLRGAVGQQGGDSACPCQPLLEQEYNGNPDSVGYRIRYARADGRGQPVLHVIRDRVEREFTIEDLEEWTEYRVQVQAFNAIGSGPWSPSVLGRTRESVPSSGPSNVSAVASSSSSLVVRWNDIPEADCNGLILGYKVSSCPCPAHGHHTFPWGNHPAGSGVPGCATARSWCPSVPAWPGCVTRAVLQVLYKEKGSEARAQFWLAEGNASRSAQLTGLAKYTLYEIRVLAFTRIGDGVPSRPPVLERTLDDVTPISPPAVPGPPVGLLFPEVRTTLVRLIWQPPAAPNGVILGRWGASRASRAGVLCRGPVGAGIAVGRQTPAPWDPLSISEPSGLKFPTRMLVASWVGAPPCRGWDGAPPPRCLPAAYQVSHRLNTSAVTAAAVEVLEASARQFTATGLQPEATYLFRVTAQTRKGWGEAAEALVVTTEKRARPQPPGKPLAQQEEVRARSVLLSWEPGSDGLSPVRYYTVQSRELPDGDWALHSAPVSHNATAFVVDRLKPFTSYKFRVKATNDIGDSEYSEESESLTTLQAGQHLPGQGQRDLRAQGNSSFAPGHLRSLTTLFSPTAPEEAPTILSITPHTTTSVLIRWQPPAEDKINGILLGFRLRYRELVYDSLRGFALRGIGHPSWAELTPVYAVHNLSEVSLTQYELDRRAGAPLPPPSSCSLGTPPSSPTRVGELCQVPRGCPITGRVPLTLCPPDLSKHRRYEIRMSVYNAVGEGPPSPPQEVFVGEAGVPLLGAVLEPPTAQTRQCGDTVPSLGAVPTGAPQNVAVQAATATQLDVTWEPPPVESQNGDIQGYKIHFWEEQRQNESARVKTLFLPESGVKLKNLTGYTSYWVSVAAFNAAGDGPRSPPVKARTQQAAPSAPGSIRFSELTTTSVNVSWEPPALPNGVLEGYRLIYEPCTPVDGEAMAGGSGEGPAGPGSASVPAGVSKIVTVDVKGNSPLWMKVKDLAEGVTYRFRIRAKTFAYGPDVEANITTGPGEGTGDTRSGDWHGSVPPVPGLWPPAVLWSPGAPGPPGEPFISRYGSAITIHWSSGDPGQGPITRYVIEARPSDEGLWDILIKDIPKEVTSYTFSMDILKQGVSYDFRVIAVNDYGYGTPSTPSPSVSAQKTNPFYEEWWFLVVIALVGLIFILLLVFVLIIRGQSKKYSKKSDSGNSSKAAALSHGEMVSLDEGSFPALELNNRRLSVKNSFCRKNGIYTR
ncbi:Protein sidekick-2 [Lamprotornis superbus]|uniref:Protein sidekick-2 n=1 Tax=Lamprotornis superbus TaxID=245042 RepID=A0A835NVZ6_9PASS|nr:Protein sidekick-2 [Lamprotornis superbus]